MAGTAGLPKDGTLINFPENLFRIFRKKYRTGVYIPYQERRRNRSCEARQPADCKRQQRCQILRYIRKM